jgi:hypothetical protein
MCVCVCVCRRAVLCVTGLDFVHMTYMCVCVCTSARACRRAVFCVTGLGFGAYHCVSACVCRRAVLGATGLGFVHISVLFNISHCTVYTQGTANHLSSHPFLCTRKFGFCDSGKENWINLGL